MTADETCKLIDSTLENVTEGLTNLSLDDITCPPSRRLSKAGHELLRLSPEKLSTFKIELEKKLGDRRSCVSTEILSKMEDKKLWAEEERKKLELQKKADTAKSNIPQTPAFFPGNILYKNIIRDEGKNTEVKSAKSVLKYKSKDLSEKNPFKIIELPKLAVKILGDEVSPVLKSIPEDKEIFEFTGNDVFKNLCTQLQEQLLKGPDTFPGYWRNGERVYGAQLPPISHFKKKPAFDIDIYKQFIKRQRLEHASRPMQENLSTKIISFNSFLTFRDKRIDKPE